MYRIIETDQPTSLTTITHSGEFGRGIDHQRVKSALPIRECRQLCALPGRAEPQSAVSGAAREKSSTPAPRYYAMHQGTAVRTTSVQSRFLGFPRRPLRFAWSMKI